MTNNPSLPAPRRGAVLAVLAFILAALVLVWLDSSARYEIIDKTLRGSWSQIPEIDPNSPTGREGGMRQMVLPTVGVDGYQWVMHTQNLLDQGGWRLRWTDQDNALAGREVHWSQSFMWWLIGVGKVHSLMTGWPLPASVEAVAPYANTLILALLIVILPWLVFRPFGAIAACAVALAPAAIYPLYEFFYVGNPDHHGIVTIFNLLCVLFLAIGGGGWVTRASATVGESTSEFEREVSEGTARFWFAASGLAGAGALWVSAATAVPMLVGIGIGAVASVFFFGRGAGVRTVYRPELWTRWGLWGAAGSLFFYLLEYFPGHMGMRLEVNHPLYALAWFCGGALITRIARWRLVGTVPWNGAKGLVTLILLVLGVLALPLVVAVASDRVFWVSDRFLWLFHKDYIMEFRTFWKVLTEREWLAISVFASIIPLLGLFVVRLFPIRGLGASWKGPMLLLLGPAVLGTALALMQIRWFGVATALWLALLPVWLGCVMNSAFPHRFSVFERVLALLFLVGLAVQYPRVATQFAVERLGREQSIGISDAYNTVVRDLAHFLRRQAGDKELVVLSGPTTTNWMMYYGGMKGVGTLYWENIAGLKAAAGLYGARTESEALELVKKHGITHIVIFSADVFSNEYIRLIRDLPKGEKIMDAFAPTLLYTRSWPRWVTPLHYVMPEQLAKNWVAILEVRPDQTEGEARLGMGRYFATKGMMNEAQAEYRAAVAVEPENTDANLEMAGLAFLTRDFATGRKHLERGLAGRSADDVAATCFHIATLCREVGHDEIVAELLQRALAAKPDSAGVVNELARVLATSSDTTVRNPERALSLASGNKGLADRFVYLETLATAQAACGQFEKAANTAEEAVQVATSAGESAGVIQSLTARRDAYATEMFTQMLKNLSIPQSSKEGKNEK